MDAFDLPATCHIDEVMRRDHFLLEGAEGNLWYEQRSLRVLFVTFDNLATLDDPYPRLPWMHSRVTALGYSLLGVQSFAKDWFRQATAPDFIRALQAVGFFARFETVVFVGASMGAFAALNFATLVPGARVLAFSPQSTMSQKICPFETRFGYAVRRSNWTDPTFLDAADAVAHLAHAVILFDPFVPEDRAHAARLTGPNITQIKADHFTHQAIRVVIKCDALPEMFAEYAETGRLGADFWRRLRARKALRVWRRAFMESLVRRGQPRRILRAANAMLRDERYLFAAVARDAVLKAHPELKVPELKTKAAR